MRLNIYAYHCRTIKNYNKRTYERTKQKHKTEPLGYLGGRGWCHAPPYDLFLHKKLTGVLDS